MLKKFRMENCKPMSTPTVTRCKLSKEDESSSENQTLYKLMIGSLLYLIASKSNIMQVVGLVARFQNSQKETHVQAMKIISKYFNGAMRFGF